MAEPTEIDEGIAEAAAERHASWIELFFDLVAVAGVAQLAHLLSGSPSAGDVGLYGLLYLAFWTAWAAFTMYGNVAGDRVRVPMVLVAMLGLAVMAAAVPKIRTEHAVAFAAAFVFIRFLGSGVWRRGQVVVDWPLAQMSVGALPWVVSLWVGAPGRYRLWALGIALDLLVMFTVSGHRALASARHRMDQVIRRHGEAAVARRNRGVDPAALVEAAPADPVHLAERLGLYVIIVLGEGVIQVTTGADGVDWDAHLAFLALGAFVLLVGIWALSLLYGYAGVPHLRAEVLPTHLAMALHCFSTGAIAAMAAGLGAATEHAGGPLPTSLRWVLCGGAAVYLAIAATGGLCSGAGRRWLLGWALPGVALPLVLGLAGADLGAEWLVWPLILPVGWHLSHEARPRPAPGPDAHEPAAGSGSGGGRYAPGA